MTAGRKAQSLSKTPSSSRGKAFSFSGGERKDGAIRSEFGADYYRRFYGSKPSAVHGPVEIRRQAGLLLAWSDLLDVRPKRLLDLGCGLGFWRDALADLRPRLRFTGVEFSGYLAREMGWIQGSVVDFASTWPFDLVICQSVVQYLDERAAARAIANLGRLCSGLLYFEALTREDWHRHVDRRMTDGEAHLRPAEWYRQKLARQFRPLGGGVYLRKTFPAVLFELEARG